MSNGDLCGVDSSMGSPKKAGKVRRPDVLWTGMENRCLGRGSRIIMSTCGEVEPRLTRAWGLRGG